MRNVINLNLNFNVTKIIVHDNNIYQIILNNYINFIF